MGIKLVRTLITAGLVVALHVPAGFGSSPAAAAVANPWPHTVVNGFSTPSGDGFWLAYADGTVEPYGDAVHLGDASNLALNGAIVGGAAMPDGTGYWLVATDGGVFSYGAARFHGSMGAVALNEPVFTMASTATGAGYWLAARDGGIFTFGDGEFHGSTGDLVLAEPIHGITTSPTGEGYRLVARDGGIFSFGDAPFLGSVPGLGLDVSDVAGMAPTPGGLGYWVVRESGDTYAFGDAAELGAPTVVGCDPVVGIFSNPAAPGYRLVFASGRTAAFGDAPGGDDPTVPAGGVGSLQARPWASPNDTFADPAAAAASFVSWVTALPHVPEDVWFFRDMTPLDAFVPTADGAGSISFRVEDVSKGLGTTDVTTTICLRRADPDGTWWVSGAVSDAPSVSEPRPYSTVDSPLSYAGENPTISAAVTAQVYADGNPTPLVHAFVSGGGIFGLGPFADEWSFLPVTFDRPAAGGAGTVVFYSSHGITTIPVLFASS